MKIRIHGTVLYIIKNKTVIFTINNKWIARLWRACERKGLPDRRQPL